MSRPNVREQTNRLVEYIGQLVITEGSLQGKPLHVMPWQKKVCGAIIRHGTIGLSMARGNAKTSTAAAIATSAIDPDGPLFVERGEIILVASSLSQARTAFRHILGYMRPILGSLLTDGRSSRRSPWRLLDSSHHREIEHRESGTLLRCIGCDPKRAHGLAPTLIIADEPAKWQSGGDEMYVALDTSRGKQIFSKLFAIGTKPDHPEHWFSRLLQESKEMDDAWAMNYCAEPGDDEFALTTVRKANPAYRFFPELRKQLASDIKRAKTDKRAMLAYRALRLNMGTPETWDKETVVPAEDWEEVHVDTLPERKGPVFVGIDLGTGNSMSAIAFYWPECGRLEVTGAFPEKPTLLEHGRMDGVNERYQTMFERGELLVYPGYATDNQKFVEEMFETIKDDEVIKIYADRYKDLEVKNVLMDTEWGPLLEFTPVGTGKDGSEFVVSFKYEVFERTLKTAYNLLLDHAMKESILRYADGNANPSLDKRRLRGRIDAMQAAILAVGGGRRWRCPDEADSIEFGAALAKDSADDEGGDLDVSDLLVEAW